MSADNFRLETDLYLDISCPWCYLAHKRFVSALAALESAKLPQTLPKDKVRIRVHPFFVNHKQRLLEDGSERPAVSAEDLVAAKPMDPFEDEERKEKAARLKELAAQDGLIIRPGKNAGDTSQPSSASNPRQLPNTTAAHRLLRWIQNSEEGYAYPLSTPEDPKMGLENGWNKQRDEEGAYEERLPYKVLEQLFKVQFEVGGNLDDVETLVAALSKSTSLPPSTLSSASQFLSSPSLKRSILLTELSARNDHGVTGVPWYRFQVVDNNITNKEDEERSLISFELVGAQDKENFERLVGRAVMKGRERMEKRYGGK